MIVRSICNYFELIKNKCYVAENYDHDYYVISLSEDDRRLFLKNIFIIVDNNSIHKEGYSGGYTFNSRVSEDEIIVQYLDKKLNLLIDQNAPECMKTLIQNLIDELIVNK